VCGMVYQLHTPMLVLAAVVDSNLSRTALAAVAENHNFSIPSKACKGFGKLDH